MLKRKTMKSYTECNGEVKEVNIIGGNEKVKKIEYFDLDGRREAYRTATELFTSKAKAKKYFN